MAFSADDSRMLLGEMVKPIDRAEVLRELHRMSERMASPRFQRSMGRAV